MRTLRIKLDEKAWRTLERNVIERSQEAIQPGTLGPKLTVGELFALACVDSIRQGQKVRTIRMVGQEETSADPGPRPIGPAEAP